MSITGTVQTVGNTFSSITPTPSDDFFAVRYIPQNLSTSQREQARANIEAISVAEIDTIISNVEFNNTTRILDFTRQNGTHVRFDLRQDIGVENISLNSENNLLIEYLNGNSDVINLRDLVTGYVQSINGITGNDIELNISDIPNLNESLLFLVPKSRIITIDGVSQNLESNIAFTTNSIKSTPQSLNLEQKEQARTNIDAASNEDILTLRGLTLTADHATSMIYVRDANGQELASLSIAFANNEGSSFVFNQINNTLDLKNDAGVILSSIPVSSFVTNLVSSANWNGALPSKLDFKDNTGTALFSINFTISNIAGLTTALDSKANKDGSNITSGTYWSNLTSNNSIKWNSQEFLNSELSSGLYYVMGFDVNDNKWKPTSLNKLITTADLSTQTWTSNHFVNKTGDIMSGSLQNYVTGAEGSYNHLSRTNHSPNADRYHYLAETIVGGYFAKVFYVDHSGLIVTSNHGNSSEWNAAFLGFSTLGNYVTVNEVNNIYDQLSAKANTRLSNVVSDLSEVEKRVIKDKLEIKDFREYGLGSQNSRPLPNDNADALTLSGIYATNTEWIGSPYPGNDIRNMGFIQLSHTSNPDYCLHTFFSAGYDDEKIQILYRKMQNGAYSNWTNNSTQFNNTLSESQDLITTSDFTSVVSASGDLVYSYTCAVKNNLLVISIVIINNTGTVQTFNVSDELIVLFELPQNVYTRRDIPYCKMVKEVNLNTTYKSDTKMFINLETNKVFALFSSTLPPNSKITFNCHLPFFKTI